MTNKLTPIQLRELANDLNTMGQRIITLAKCAADVVLGTKMQKASRELLNYANAKEGK